MKLNVFCGGFGFYQELLAQCNSILCCHSRSQIWEKAKHALIYISVCGIPYLAWNFSVSNIHSGEFTNQVSGNALSNSYTINSVLSKDCRMYILQRLRITYHSESHKTPILVFFPNSLTRTPDWKWNIYSKWLLFL